MHQPVVPAFTGLNWRNNTPLLRPKDAGGLARIGVPKLNHLTEKADAAGKYDKGELMDEG